MTFIASIQPGWLSRLWRAVDRRLNRSDIRSICLLVLVIYSIILSISFATQRSGRTIFGPQLGADFGAYYIAGTIFNHVAPDRIYDRNLHHRLYQEHFPSAPPGEELPYVNAPFFILLFPVLARLEYPLAYLVWILISLGLFVSGFTLLWRTLDDMPEDAYFVALFLAVSFMPFLVECLAGGQTSAFGFFSLAMAISCERRDRPITGGAALSLCLYKPTLLLLILPMLVITRRISTIAGFVIGGSLLAATSLLVVGWQGCLEYIRMLLFFTDASTSAVSGLKSWKYVDVNSFFRLLLNHHIYLRWVFVATAFLMILPLLFSFWLRACRESKNDQSLVWAGVLTWTMILNVYLGIYDTTLVVLSVLLITHVFYGRTKRFQFELTAIYKLIILLLYLVPWATQPIARLTGVQLYTIILVLFGIYQLSRFKMMGESSAVAREHAPISSAVAGID